MKSTEANILAKVLGNLNLFSKKLQSGRSNIENKKEKQRGIINLCAITAT